MLHDLILDPTIIVDTLLEDALIFVDFEEECWTKVSLHLAVLPDAALVTTHVTPVVQLDSRGACDHLHINRSEVVARVAAPEQVIASQFLRQAKQLTLLLQLADVNCCLRTLSWVEFIDI